jgi:succinate-semialdehyde dehydrogenase/glutarate-semialdehyde dehydrogenase/succinyl-CoA reductase
MNCGQSCIAAKRFLIVEEIVEEFVDAFVEKMEQLTVGDPLDTDTDLGPMVREGALEDLDRQVRESVRQGARLVAGGERIDGPGFFYEPTVLTGVELDMTVMKEETFGPVAPIMSVKNDDEAVQAANATEFGLGGSIWTSDLERGERMARHMEAGITTVNGIVSSDPRVPFGGVKKSGFGRELSKYGLLEFSNIKTVRLHEAP